MHVRGAGARKRATNPCAEQRKDPTIAKILDFMKEGTKSAYTRQYIVDPGTNLLYKIGKPGERRRLFIPVSMRLRLLNHFHGAPLQGHAGRNKTIGKLCRRFYWPAMSTDVAKWVRSCMVCRKRKAYQPKQSLDQYK